MTHPAPPYTLYVSDVSCFSGKLEAFLRYKNIGHRRVAVTVPILRREVLPGTGFMKVPCIRCADGRWLKDTTPMIAWLDARHPHASIYPADPAKRFLALLIEDYADEWLWRPAMHWRWSHAESHALLRRRLGRELTRDSHYPAWAMGAYMRWRQWWVFVRGDGVRRHNRAHVEAIYHDTLTQLSALLAVQPYLHGARPGLADFAFFGPMFRHFALDPASARVMVDRAPSVYAWVARLWNARASGDESPAAGFSSPAWDAVFEQLGRQYLPYLDANAAAFAHGRRRFDHHCDGVPYPRLPVVRYRVACREQLLRHYRALTEAQRTAVQARLAGSAASGWLDTADDVPAGLDHEFEMPLSRRYPPARGLHGLKLYAGTPWDMPRAPTNSNAAIDAPEAGPRAKSP